MRRQGFEKIESCHDAKKRKHQRMCREVRFECKVEDPPTFACSRVCIPGAFHGGKGGMSKPRAYGTFRTPSSLGGITEKTPDQSEAIEQCSRGRQNAHGPYTQTISPVPLSGETDLLVDGCTTLGMEGNPCYDGLNTSPVRFQSLAMRHAIYLN